MKSLAELNIIILSVQKVSAHRLGEIKVLKKVPLDEIPCGAKYYYTFAQKVSSARVGHIKSSAELKEIASLCSQ